MSTYSFKSSGLRPEKEAIRSIEKSSIPIGIKTPLQLTEPGVSFGDVSEIGEIFITHSSLEDAIGDNLKNLLLTNWGDRVGFCEFGANLKPLALEWTTHENFDEVAILQINNAVERWMPFVSLEDFSSQTSLNYSNNLTRVDIKITYTVPQIGDNLKKIKLSLFVT